MDGRKRRIRRKNNPWPTRIIILVLGIVFLAIVANTGKGLIIKSMLSTTEATNGILEERVEGEGLIFLNESIIKSPYSGNVNRQITNGQRVSKQEKFAQVEAFGASPSGKKIIAPLTSPISGILLYWYDGLEGVFTKDILGNSDIEKLFAASNVRVSAQSVREGENVAKVVDNLRDIYLVAKMPNSLSPGLQNQDKAKIVFDGFITDASVLDSKNTEGEVFLLVKLSDMPPGFKNGRLISFILVRNEYRGVVLPKEAIVTKNNALGVYIVETKKAKWKEVKLVGAVNDKIVISGLNNTDVIILNPKWVKEGEFAE